MKILVVGDVYGRVGLDFLAKMLRKLKKQHGADMVIVNGENSGGNGLVPSHADEIFAAGADIITLGNHALDMHQIHDYADECRYMARPMNLPPQQPGFGYSKMGICGKTVCVIPLLGRAHMGRFDYENPFRIIDEFLKKDDSDIYIVDFHAETTSEKKAMGYFLDGRVSAVFGTHTHVQTADEQILPLGTGYITDVGMCGAYHSVIGVDREQAVARFRGDIVGRHKESKEAPFLCGIVFTLDENGKCTDVLRIQER